MTFNSFKQNYCDKVFSHSQIYFISLISDQVVGI